MQYHTRRWSRGTGASNLSQSQIQAMIVASAQQYGVDPALALSIAQTESSFNPAAVSKPNSNGTQDYGLMQINSSNFASLGLTSATALDPQSNINAAMSLLSTYTQKYGDNPQLIAWAYNAGPGSVASGSIPASTSNYVSQVVSGLDQFSSYSDGGDTLSLSDALGTPDTTDTSGDITVAGLTVSPQTAALVGFGILAGLLVWFRD